MAELAKPILDLDTRQDRQRGRTQEGREKEKDHRGSLRSRQALPIQQTPGRVGKHGRPTFLPAAIEAVSSGLSPVALEAWGSHKSPN